MSECSLCNKPLDEHRLTKLGKPICPRVTQRDIVSAELPVGMRQRLRRVTDATSVSVSHKIRESLIAWVQHWELLNDVTGDDSKGEV